MVIFGTLKVAEPLPAALRVPRVLVNSGVFASAIEDLNCEIAISAAIERASVRFVRCFRIVLDKKD